MALFSKKPEDKDSEVKYEVTTAAPAGGKLPTAKIPTVLVQPRISEKAGRLSGLNKYVFRVLSSANKLEIRKAVESFYKVHVTGVNIINTQGKRRTYGRTSGQMSDFKKAVVTLKQGDKIEGTTETV